ncbi:hypothetical protein I3F58_02100 [Streptomyces sp. MUM 203J]|uniref:DUF6415 family natural product biosynthesis protein n=1 Tax=Streptomyces sp. MUM 203J TaxID=2791990 RepID=UPI001F036C89|nr:DUF6415 family natural product biosynthesis protein [Streptomyces sp. MUM 203J]MCH0538372.1 hypothetical protein [Streptomyces sp. MUM 203J]
MSHTAGPVDVTTIRETADRILCRDAVSPAEADELAERLRGHVRVLMPEVAALADALTVGGVAADDVRRCTSEADFWINIGRAFTERAHRRQMRELARAARTLCWHYESLTAQAVVGR